MTTVHLTREICPQDLNYRKSKTNMGAQKLLLARFFFFSCLSEIGLKQKLSFGRQLLSNSVCVRKTLFVAQCPKFKARVFISVAIKLVGDRDQKQFENYRFPPYGPTVSRQITYLLFSCSKLVLQPITNGFVYSTLSLNRVARRLLKICKKIFPTNE